MVAESEVIKVTGLKRSESIRVQRSIKLVIGVALKVSPPACFDHPSFATA